jgi:cell division inhibitor SulA
MNMTVKADIARLLDATPQLWTGRQFSGRQRALPTGHARLDARLPGGGWPLGAVSEIVAASPGLGEFSLLFPALAELGAQGQWVVLVDPPWIPYPAALRAQGLRLERLLLVRTRDEKDALWACEQALCSGHGGAVLAWPRRLGFARVRRLQLAAEAHAKLAFLFRPESALGEASPAALRLQLEPGAQQDVSIRVIKCRGSRPPDPTWISRPFSAHGNPQDQTHADDLACPSLPAPGPGPAYPGPGAPHDAHSAQRPG